MNRAWREANPGYWRRPDIVERNRQWQQDHPERMREINNAARRRRRARLAGAAVSEMGATEVYVSILRLDPCAYCGGPAGDIDHIQAVSAGGGHVWSNMTSACRSCNAIKHTASLLTALLRAY
jgi:5-methylcytosine-specific restriction endonuclease McrA